MNAARGNLHGNDTFFLKPEKYNKKRKETTCLYPDDNAYNEPTI